MYRLFHKSLGLPKTAMLKFQNGADLELPIALTRIPESLGPDLYLVATHQVAFSGLFE